MFGLTICLCIDILMDGSKPIRRPVLKQVLHKFATIPEESEASVLTSASR